MSDETTKGGLGTYIVHKAQGQSWDELRARGDLITTGDPSGHSKGVIPFLKIQEEALRSVCVGRLRPNEAYADFAPHSARPDNAEFLAAARHLAEARQSAAPTPGEPEGDPA